MTRYGPFSTYAPRPVAVAVRHGCSHQAPESCSWCDGTEQEAEEMQDYPTGDAA